MYLNGRWVPLETVNTIFALWAIAVVGIGMIVFVFWRRRPPSKRDGKALVVATGSVTESGNSEQ